MTISATSRYASSTVTPGTNLAGNDIMVIQFDQPEENTFQFTYYQVKANDFVDVLAYRVFGDPTLWWVIANANPEITDWLVLIPGTLLRIPTLTSAAVL